MSNKTRSFLLCLCVICLLPAALACTAIGIPPQFDRTYLAALQDKMDLLRTTEGKRIILIGGSGAAFDIRSDLLETELPGYTPVNFGLYAGLGTTVMLDLAEKYIRVEDIVLFLPEQNEQTLSAFFDGRSLWQALDGGFGTLSDLPVSYFPKMAGAFPRFSAEKTRYYWDGEKPSGDAIYARASFNRYGDITCSGRERNKMAYGYDPNTLIRFDDAVLSPGFLEKVNAFSAKCSKRGAAFYYTFCPMNAAAVLPEETEKMNSFQSDLQEKLDCPLIGSVQDAVMDPRWFFDTNFHLNEAGQIMYTAYLAAELKNILKIEGTVAIEPPDMPALEAAQIRNGDNRDAGLFLYERSGNGYRIIGLQPEGKNREQLIIPYSYLELPVIGFSADTFQNNQRITEIIIDGNITLIEDSAFRGCTNLKRIVMRSPLPQVCSVGNALLDGTDAYLFVPDDSFSAYATNYFWSLYADRMEKSHME